MALIGEHTIQAVPAIAFMNVSPARHAVQAADPELTDTVPGWQLVHVLGETEKYPARHLQHPVPHLETAVPPPPYPELQVYEQESEVPPEEVYFTAAASLSVFPAVHCVHAVIKFLLL